jgi:protein gp37
MSFEDEDEALNYAIHNQRDRRNLTDADILRLVEAVDKRKKTGPKDSASNDAKLGKSAAETAEVIGTSQAKVEKARTVINHAPDEVKEEVKSGKSSINRAYKEAKKAAEHRRDERKTTKALFNQTNEKIEWAKWTWNPVVGCKHGCPYCYARGIAERFMGHFKPTFYPERLVAPRNMTIPEEKANGMRNVFVCSMADLFGEWVPQEWIDAVMAEVKNASQWNFIFLTKNPARLADVRWPPNAWVGATVDCQERVKPTIQAFKKIKARVRFISCEPLREPINFHEGLDNVNWLIVGGWSEGTRIRTEPPKWQWVESLLNQARKAGGLVYFKPNLNARPMEFPE